MPGVRRFDHAGVVVDDLDLVTEFFVDLGFEASGPMRIEGRWVDRVVGLDGVHADMVTVNAPDGSGRLELTKFYRPVDPGATQAPLSNLHGLRHLAYIVDDVHGVVERLRAKGLNTIGDIVNYENIFHLVYVSGPEGLIVELAEEIGRH